MSRDSSLSPNTKVPLWWIALTITTTATIVLFFNTKLNNIDQHINDIRRESLTQEQMRDWIDTSRDLNPTVKYPPIPKKNVQDLAAPLAVVTRKEP